MDQDASSTNCTISKPQAIPEDCICLGEYTSETVGCRTSRTDNTDVDACSPHSAKRFPCMSESCNDASNLAFLSSRTDDTDDGSPRKARRITRCNTRDLVDIVDRRTQQVAKLLQAGNDLVTEKPIPFGHQLSDPSPCKSTARMTGHEWEKLHDEANACLQDVHDRLVTLQMDEETAEEDTSVACAMAISASQEVQELRQVVDGLVTELSEVKKGEAEMRQELDVLRERVSRVDRQAAKASSDVAEMRHENERRSLQNMHIAPLSSEQETAALQKIQQAENMRRPMVPKLRLQASSGVDPSHTSTSTSTCTSTSTSTTTGKPHVPLLKIPQPASKISAGSKQIAGSHARMQPRASSNNTTKPTRPFMGQNFFRK